MAAAVSIHSYDQRVSNAALIGSFDAANADFLAEHLDELVGDVVLDCTRLESLDARAAGVLLRFRSALRRRGRQLMFRSLPDACRAVLVHQAHGTPRSDRASACA
jgi:anti-anti-sigma regulatory factor